MVHLIGLDEKEVVERIENWGLLLNWLGIGQMMEIVMMMKLVVSV